MVQSNLLFHISQYVQASNKDVLPIVNLSNVIYLFDCGCGHSYIGRTTQRLGEGVKQHVPAGLTHSTTPKESMVTTRKKPGRPRKNNVDRDGDSMHAHVHVSAPISSRTRSKASVAPPSTDERALSVGSGVSAKLTLTSAKTDTAITRHLKNSLSCLEVVSKDVISHFSILARGRHLRHLCTLEAVFIARRKPELCAQKEYVHTLWLS